MTVKGIRLYDNTVSPAKPENYSVDEVLERGEKGLNMNKVLASALVKYVTAPHYDTEDDSALDYFSVSMLGWCLRQAVLKKTHDYYEAIEGVIATWNGTLVHAELEKEALQLQKHDPDIEAVEKKMFEEFEIHDKLVRFRGTTDLIYRRGTKLIMLDWKTTSNMVYVDLEKKDAPKHYESQINIYAYLLRNEYQFSELEIMKISPKGGNAQIKVNKWTEERTLNFIKDRLGKLVKAAQGELPKVSECRAMVGYGDMMCKGFPIMGHYKVRKALFEKTKDGYQPTTMNLYQKKPLAKPVPCPFWETVCKHDYARELEAKRNKPF